MEAGQEQRLAVIASLSDGTERDVTDAARFDTLNEGVATVRPGGLAKTVGRGEASIMVRYQGRAAMARLTVPFGRERPFEFPSQQRRRSSRRPPSGASSGWFLRRFAPTPNSSAARCSMRSEPRRRRTRSKISSPIPIPDKRAKLVDRILDRPEYVDYWTLKWGDVLRVNSEKLGAQGMLAFNLWLREAFRSNMHVDRMAEELVTAQGSIFSNGPANYFRVATQSRRPGRDDGPGFHGRAASVRAVPSSSVRGVRPGRLLLPGRVLRTGANQAKR